MKNLIIQHYILGKPGLDPNRKFEGELPMLVRRSMENIKRYAESMNAEYKMLDGKPFRDNLTYKCQKCAIINEEYDDYDVVVAMDTDVFVTNNCKENLFEAKGIGYSGRHQNGGARKIQNICPGYGSGNTSFWSGAVYVLDKHTRKKMRECITSDMEQHFVSCDTNGVWDEGIFHILAAKIGIGKVSLDNKWNYDSYLDNLQSANIIHIRHKPKNRDQNYLDLVERRIIT